MNPIQLFKRSVMRWWQANPGNLGAALSYYVFFSLTPLFSLLIVLLGRFFPVNLIKDQIVATSYAYAGSNIASTIQEFINNTRGVGQNITAAIIGLIVLGIGSLGVFNQLQLSLNKLWDAPEKSGLHIFIKERIAAFIIFIILGLVLVGSVMLNIAASVVINYISSFQIISPKLLFVIPVGDIIIFIATVLIIDLMYLFLSRVTLLRSARWWGSLGTALLFLIGEYLLKYYLSSYSFSSSYGALGTLAVLLIWVYYSAQIFFFGAAWTYSVHEALSQRHEQPNEKNT